MCELKINVGSAVLRTHLSSSSEDLPGDEERGGKPDHVAERCLTGQQIVLVGAIAVALAIGVVLVDGEALTSREQLHCRLGGAAHHDLAHLVIKGPLEAS